MLINHASIAQARLGGEMRRAAQGRKHHAPSCRRSYNYSARRSAAWWRRYYSPQAVARRKRAARLAARRKRIEKRRKARRYAALGYAPLPSHSAKWWRRYDRTHDTGCPKPPHPGSKKKGRKVSTGKAQPATRRPAAARARSGGASPALRSSRPAHSAKTRRKIRR
jgi:hypothetical protein